MYRDTIAGQTMKNEELKINGMNCDHCVMSVRKELERLPGVEVKDVRIGSALVAYDESRVTGALLKSAVEEAGFSIA
jgi:copper chaperone